MNYEDINKVKGLVGGIQKFSTEDGPGIRTTVFLKGCPLSCKWCHNPELIDPEIQIMTCPNKCIGCGICAKECTKKAIVFTEGKATIDRRTCDRCMKCTEVCCAKALNPAGSWMTVEEVMWAVLQDRDFYHHTNGGMTISGGELLAQADFADSLIQACEMEGIGVVLDTSGYGSYKKLAGLAGNSNCTHILYDMKLINGNLHREFTGVDNDFILSNLRKLAADPDLRSKLILRMPLIHNINDKEEIIRETCGFYKEIGIKSVTLLPYHQLGIDKTRHLGGIPTIFETPSMERVEEIRGELTAIGIEVEVLGQ